MAFLNLPHKISNTTNLPPQRDILTTLADLIAPAGLEISPNYLKLGNKYCATLFILTYPHYLASNWFSSLVNLDESFDLAIFSTLRR